MSEILLFGFGIPVVTAAIVQVMKAFGFPDRFAPQAALVVGVGLYYLVEALTAYPEIIPYVQPIIFGIMIWVGATGTYVLGKMAYNKVVGK